MTITDPSTDTPTNSLANTTGQPSTVEILDKLILRDIQEQIAGFTRRPNCSPEEQIDLELDRMVLVEFLKERGLTLSVALRMGIGYWSPRIARAADSLTFAAMRAGGFWRMRRSRPIPMKSVGTDVFSFDDEEGEDDKQPEFLPGLRPALGGCIVLPIWDEKGRIRSWLGRDYSRGKSLAELAGDYEPGEVDVVPQPDSGTPRPKYRYLPKTRKQVRDYGSIGRFETTKEDEFFPLLPWPKFIEIHKAPEENIEIPIVICEGVFDGGHGELSNVGAISTHGCYLSERQLDLLVEWLKPHAEARRPIYIIPDNDPHRYDRHRTLRMGPGHRGVCMMLAGIVKRDRYLYRHLRVVVLPEANGQKVDFADLQAAVVKSIPEPQIAGELQQVLYAPGALAGWETQVEAACRKNLDTLCAGAVRAREFQVAQYPTDLDPAESTDAIRETGLLDVAAHSPESFAAIGGELVNRRGLKKTEGTKWLREVEKMAKPLRIEAAKEAEGDDPLARHTREDGTIVPNYEAICAIIQQMDEKLDPLARLWWNEMGLCPMSGGRPMTDVRLGDLRLRIAREYRCHIKHKSELREAIDHLAGRNPKHPVREYLKNLSSWDRETDWIDVMMDEVLCLEPKNEKQRKLYRAFIMRWGIGACDRAFATADRPSKMDAVLTLVGPQGVGKSSFFENLVPDPAWYDSPDISDFGDQAVLKLAGIWICEQAEANGSSYHRDIERKKAFTSKRKDRIVRKYVAYAETLPRTVVLGATVNERQHLSDSSGFRRDWCMETLRPINIKRLVEIRDSYWAQVYYLWKAGEPCFLTEEEKAIHLEDGQQYQVADLERDRIRLWLVGKTVVSGLDVAGGVGLEKPTTGDSRRISRHMAALGWSAKKGKKGLVFRAPGLPEQPDDADDDTDTGTVHPSGLTVFPGGGAVSATSPELLDAILGDG